MEAGVKRQPAKEQTSVMRTRTRAKGSGSTKEAPVYIAAIDCCAPGNLPGLTKCSCIQAIIRRSPILQTRKLRPREVTKAWRSTLPSENVDPGPQDSQNLSFPPHMACWMGQGQWWERKEGKNGFLVINGPPSDDAHYSQGSVRHSHSGRTSRMPP